MPLDTKHAGWIETRVRATLSHYPQNWNEPEDVTAAVMDDWIDFLSGFSRKAIEHALSSHLQTFPKTRPTPGQIREKAKLLESDNGQGMGDRSKLSMDEQMLLSEKVLPTARRWMRDYPPSHSLHGHGKKTLDYWGEAA